VAVDSSPGMLARAGHRIDRLGLEARASTHLAALPDGIDGLAPADAIWTSMALHHVGDEVSALRAMGDRLAPHGLLAVAERADPMRVLPDALDVGRPGLADRLDRAAATWFTHMRDELADSAPSADLPTMVAAAGLDVVGARLARLRVDEPLADDARTFVAGYLHRCREQLTELLDDEDLAALDVLTDADDPRSVWHRSDVFIAASRQIVIAARRGDASTPAPDAD
jgi:SAM-dependent methyltransferase